MHEVDAEGWTCRERAGAIQNRAGDLGLRFRGEVDIVELWWCRRRWGNGVCRIFHTVDASEMRGHSALLERFGADWAWDLEIELVSEGWTNAGCPTRVGSVRYRCRNVAAIAEHEFSLGNVSVKTHAAEEVYQEVKCLLKPSRVSGRDDRVVGVEER